MSNPESSLPVFNPDSRGHLRTASASNPLRYIIRELERGLSRMIEAARLPPKARVLDFGCADQPYRHLFPDAADYIGADLPGNDAADVVIRPDGTLPLPDASFDLVFSSQVLEHVADPRRYLAECRRVLKPGGQMLLSTHGMMVYHPDPVDYWRWTGEGLRRAVGEAGFSIEYFEGIMGLAAVGLHFFQQATYRRLPRWLRSPYIALMQSLVALADRLHDAESRAHNALVFAVLARTDPGGGRGSGSGSGTR